MSKHNEFLIVINTFKAASQTISPEQRIGLLRQATQEYGLSIDEASKILDASGLIVGEKVNYFQILELSGEKLQNQSEVDITENVETAYKKRYNASLRAGGRVRPDGRTEEQWRVLLNQARDTLKCPEKRNKHILNLQQEKDNASLDATTRLIFKFPNGAEATTIPQLAELMVKELEAATDALYHGYLEQSLGRAGEMHFATAARAVVSEFPNDRQLGFKAMLQILRGALAFQKGIEPRTIKRLDQEIAVQKPNEARTPQQLAQLIDRNWEEAKTLLYNGFMALWFEYTQQPEFAGIAKKISERYSTDQDVGLETLVQELDPKIGRPELQVSHPYIDFGKVDTETQKTLELKIKNVGRGFLYGDVQLASEMPGFCLSAPPLRGEEVFTVQLDASLLSAKRMHETELVISTNGGSLKVPISCYVDYPIMKSMQRVAISGAALATLALGTRLIIYLYGNPGWVSTRLTSAGFLAPNQYWEFLRVKFVAINMFVVLEKLFYLGFDAPVLIVWLFWGLVIGAAMQGYREMKVYGRKWIRFFIAITPLLLLGVLAVAKVQTDPLLDIKAIAKRSSADAPITEDMVLIPAGEFWMGSNTDHANESPKRMVFVDAFYMDRYEVTNTEYAAFLNALEKHAEDKAIGVRCYLDDKRIQRIDGRYRVKQGYGNHPAHGVTWYGAMTYAAWVGKRLPTEAEWEKAARGGWIGKAYPWGDTIDTTKANYTPNVNEHRAETSTIGSYPPNGYGLYDMAGNVLEWCLDAYDPDFYVKAPDKNPIAGGSITSIINQFTKIKTKRVLRGGSCFDAPQAMRCAARAYGLPSGTFYRLGFRCVKPAAASDIN